ncbi:MAG: response regulator [Desulfatibacillum sp.]|nr:response regulator [Desulfatibacillum sp.]
MQEDQSNHPQGSAHSGGLKILVVEDDFVGRKLLFKHLSAFGEVDLAVDGTEAVKAFYMATLKNEPYHMICLDIMMPEMDGQEVLKSIRETETRHGIRPGQGTKIIMTTALDDTQSIMKAFREQCDGYLVKPIKRESLLQAIEDLGLLPKSQDKDKHLE